MGDELIPVLDGAAYGLLLVAVAAGMSLCFGSGGVLNLAHGTLYVLGAYSAGLLSDGTWAGLALAAVAGAAAGASAGSILAALTAPMGRHGPAGGPLAQAMVTFGVALVAGDLLTTRFGSTQIPVRVPAVLDGTVPVLGHRYPVVRLGVIVVGLLLAGAGYLVLTRTLIGARVRAAADDPQMLANLGINPRVVHSGVLVASGAVAGLAGVVGAPILGPAPGTGDTVLLLSLVVVIVGGPGSIPGAVIAALAVGQVQTVGVTLFPTTAPYLLFAAVAVALTIRGWRHSLTGRPT